MSSLGKSWSKAKAACPRPEHAGSRVRFDGCHGPPRHRRQRYRCIPYNGDRPHRFTEVLPREESWIDDCELCERDVGLHEGPHAPRKYQFVARGIAEALQMVGAGSTYREAALVARERAQRLRADPETGELRLTRHGSLVMDWVEVFAPVVVEPYRPRAWPAAGSLLLDDLPFRVSNRGSGRQRIAFRVFCAMGYEAGRPRLWRLEARTSKSQSDWEAFLGALPGAPGRVVCDNDSGLTNAVRARFPEAELYLCEWHLRHALERLMASIRRQQPEHAETIDELLPDVEAAFAGPSFWAPFTERAHAAEIERLSDWLNTTGRIVEDQFHRRGPRSTRPPDMPLSTSPMDGLINPIRASIQPRAYGLKNRERTNRLLTLMQLHANRQDDLRTYVRHIRECLEANQGRPNNARRAVVDSGRAASLR
ncbi:MAG: transposase [Actinobacteria bacterium]|nr:transposase [Actinomycetota bacterium]MCA1698691.1 transposase [Actinomycetota bacterium]